MSTFTRLMAASAVAAAVALPVTGHATNGILPLGNGMVAHGFGGAGIANGAEALSGVDNPALISRASNQWNIGASLFSPLRSADFGAGSYVDSGSNYFLIPQGGVTFNLGKQWDMGVLVTALGGMNTDYDASEINPLLTGRAGMDLKGVIVSVPFSYKFSQTASLAVAPLLGYEMMETSLPAGFFSPVDNSGSDSAIGWGVQVGFAADVGPGWTLGLMYQSKIDMAEMSTFCDGTNPAGVFAGLDDCSLDMPEQFGAGIVWQVNPAWKIVADIKQVNWSKVDVFGTAFGWKDQTIFKIGAGVKSSENLEWRFGLNYAGSPIPDDFVGDNVLAPAVTTTHLTGGLGQKLGTKSELNYYIAYVPENEQIGTGPSAGTRIKMWQWAAGIGYNAHF